LETLIVRGNKRLPREGIQEILVRGTNWIGDAIMTLPAVAAIRRTWPQARISILAKPWVADVYKESNDIDRIINFADPGRNQGPSGKIRLASELRQYRFDMAILLQNAIEAAIIARLAGIPIRAGYNSDARGWLLTHAVRRTPAIREIHQIDYYLEMVKALGCADIDRAMHLETHISPATARDIIRQYVSGNGEPVIGIAPGATYGPAKRWMPERFAAVADRLSADLDARVVLFGGKSDWETAEQVRKNARTDMINIAGKTTLQEAVYCISQCRLFISNDSGLMHVAGALNIPTVAIFGSTNPVTTSPAGEKTILVRKPVLCSPCLKKTCPTDFRCMTLITVDDVVAAANTLLLKKS
jgi:heptosyltransferase-2